MLCYHNSATASDLIGCPRPTIHSLYSLKNIYIKAKQHQLLKNKFAPFSVREQNLRSSFFSVQNDIFLALLFQWKKCIKGTIGPFCLKGQHIFFQGRDGGWGCWGSRSGYIYVNMLLNRQPDDGGALKWQHQPVEVLFLTFSTCGMSTRTGLFCAWKVINSWLLPTLLLSITSYSYMQIYSKYQRRKVSLGGSKTCLRIYDAEFSVYARGYVWSPQITEVLKGSHWFTMWPQSCLQVRETYTWFCFTSKQTRRLWTETSTPRPNKGPWTCRV